MRVIRRGQALAKPWRNGGGVTYELAVFPEAAGFDDFVWRLSMAEVASDGAFSAFPGVDRTLTLLDGEGVTLDFAAADPRFAGDVGAVSLAPGAPPLSFPGEAPIVARLTAGPILDLNVMTRRASAAHLVRVLPAGEAALPRTVALIAPRDGVRLADVTLQRADCVLAERPGALAGLSADAPLLAVSIWPRAEPGAALASWRQV